MNAVLQDICQMVLMQQGKTQSDLYLRTPELAQVQEDEYFVYIISKDLKIPLQDIQKTHQNDMTTADSHSPALDMQEFAGNYEL